MRVKNHWPNDNEIAAVYVAAVIQGLALVTFPAASTVFTSPQHYGLSSTEYGAHVCAPGDHGDWSRRCWAPA